MAVFFKVLYKEVHVARKCNEVANSLERMLKNGSLNITTKDIVNGCL